METNQSEQKEINGKEIAIAEVENNAMLNVEQAEINQQIATAKKWPRSLTKFREKALAMATMDQDVAASCFYVLPRGGKNIEGPGVRLAEIMAAAYGNMRFGARMTGDDGKYVVAQGAAFDLENNVAMTLEVRRRITDRYGKRYNDDLIALTANAACSIALRNAIFRVIPKAFVEPIYKAAKEAAIGTVATLSTRREKMLAHFAKMGVDKERIFAAMEVKGIDDIDLSLLEKLIGISTAIKDGEVNVDFAFPALGTVSEEPAASKTEAVAKKMKKTKEDLFEREPGE